MSTQLFRIHAWLTKQNFNYLSILEKKDQEIFWQLYVAVFTKVAEFYDIFEIFTKLYRMFIFKTFHISLHVRKILLHDILVMLLVNKNIEYNVGQYLTKSYYPISISDVLIQIYKRYIQIHPQRVKTFLLDNFRDDNQVKRHHQILLFLHACIYCIDNNIYDVFTERYKQIILNLASKEWSDKSQILGLIQELQRFPALYDIIPKFPLQLSSFQKSY